jgi:hypothetical protein
MPDLGASPGMENVKAVHIGMMRFRKWGGKASCWWFPDLRLFRKQGINDHNKNRSGQSLSGFISGQVGQESNLQPAVLEFTCLLITSDND